MAGSRGIKAGRAFVELFADDSRLVRGLRRAQKRIKAFGAGVTAAGMRMAKASGAFMLPFAAGAKAFADFETQMASVSTMLDEPEKHMQKFKTGIREMSVEFGEGTETLAKGLYDILSASIPAEKAMDVLAVSARAAKAGLTDTGVAADAITTILNSYNLSADKAGQVSDLLFKIVKRGKTTFGELAPKIGMVASIASSAGIGLDELGSALAVMTRNGIATDQAITATRSILTAFLKPSKEAAEYAETLGFAMSSTALKTEGLVGVFERIKNLPPDAIAKLFPNVRALAGVIPAIKNMEGFANDLDEMRNSAGSTEEAYKKMSNTLAMSFNRAKQMVIGAFSKIGEAIAEPLKQIGAVIKQYGQMVSDWIGKNKELFGTIFKIVAIVGLLGIGIMAAGWAISFVGGVLGVFATVAKVVTVALGVLKIAFFALLSPIGLVVAAVVGLGVWIFTATDLGNKALEWLGDGFGQLFEDAKSAIGAIGKALAAGDIGLAAKILWRTLVLVWEQGIGTLKKAWLQFKHFFIRLAVGAFLGAVKVFEYVWYGLEIAWIESTAFLAKVWHGFVSFFKRSWVNMSSIAQKAWAWISKLGGLTGDTKKAYKRIDRERDSALAKIDDEENSKKQAAELKRQRKRERAKRTHEGTLDVIDDIYKRADDSLSKEIEAQDDRNRRKIAQARKDWQESIDEAQNLPEKKKDRKGPEKFDPTDLLFKAKEAVVAGVGGAQAKVIAAEQTRGTFNAAAVQALAGGVSASERTALATEQTAKNTAVIKKRTKKKASFS